MTSAGVSKGTDLTAWGWFAAWAVLGAVVGFATVVFLALALIPDILAIAFMWTVRAARRSAFGLAAGAGMPLLWIAYLNREGPGTTCWQTATASGCEEHLDPLPWLAIGAVLLLVGVVGQVRRNRAAD